MRGKVSRNKKLMWNTVSSLTFQVTTVLCGFILPRLILQSYGSEVNGLISSVQQFLQIIAFLELGVGAVVKSSLYKPLAEKDNRKISEILASANKFFKRLAGILLVYVVVLIACYPAISNQSVDWTYSALLIAAMSISSFAQYYFGIVNQLLLTADQRGYIQYVVQIITLVVNTAACALLIQLGSSIQMVKLTSSLIFLARPLVLKLYVDKHYQIDRKIQYIGEPIKQKWNGVAQHVTAVILDSTDSVVLTIFASLADVSIYYVYHMVVYGVKQLFTVAANGVQSALGELWARKEYDELRDMFGWVEWSVHTSIVFLFTCTGLLVVPFVSVYTKGIEDINYIVPLFAVLITLANAMHCMRMPYNIMLLAAGHYKQTQKCYIMSAALNIVISIATVKAFGLIGVAIGTLVGMAYQTIWMTRYISENIIQWPLKTSMKQCAVDAITVLLIILATRWMPMILDNYWQWVLQGIFCSTIAGVIIVLVNLICYRKRLSQFTAKIVARKKGNKK